MAFQIKNGWRIPAMGLKQWTQNVKQDKINLEELDMRIFGPKGIKVQNQYIKLHQFRVFLAAFPAFTFSYTLSMPKINVSDCKTERKMETYAFVPSIFSESSLSNNLLVFENFIIIQMGIDKTDSQQDDWLTIWQSDQKTKA